MLQYFLFLFILLNVLTILIIDCILLIIKLVEIVSELTRERLIIEKCLSFLSVVYNANLLNVGFFVNLENFKKYVSYSIILITVF